MSYKKFLGSRSSWEAVAFMIIKKILVGNNPFFYRTELMKTKHLSFAVKLLGFMGHKKKPKHPDKTLQKTIQNMRDKGFIEFLGQGEYKLTKKGYEEMEKVAEEFKYDSLYAVLKDAGLVF